MHLPIYTFVCAVVVYGIALTIYATNVQSRWAEWVASVIFWLLLIFIYYAMLRFVKRVFTEPLEPWYMFWSVADFYFAFVHAQAGLGMSIYLLDSAPAKDTWFIVIDSAASPFAIYVGDFLFNTVTVFNTAGWVGIRPRPSTVPGALWGIFLGASAWFYAMFVLNVILRSIKKGSPLSQKVAQKSLKSHANAMEPLFRAEYTGLAAHSGIAPANPLSRMRVMPKKKKRTAY